MAAILACMQVGVSDEKIAEGLRTFPQVEHRLETVRVVEGVTYINDSKATNVDSAWYALDSMTTPVIWIAGGLRIKEMITVSCSIWYVKKSKC